MATDDITCDITEHFARALHHVSQRDGTPPINRIAVFEITNGETGPVYYRLMIGRGDKGATDLLEDEIAATMRAGRLVNPDFWHMTAERLFARLALVEAGKDFTYSERAWKAETEGRFSPTTPLPPVKHTIVIMPGVRVETVTAIQETRDIEFVILGPRDPFLVTNEKTGHTFLYDAPLEQWEALKVDTRAQRVIVTTAPLSVVVFPDRPAYDHFVRPDRELLNPNYVHLFSAWFALCEGAQTIRIDPLVKTLANVLTEGMIQ